MPYHSILISAYNRFNYLKKTIESCLASRDPDYEIIVADDGSDEKAADKFYAYIEALDDRVRIYRYRVNRGVGHRFAELHQQANGKLLHLIGSDDLMHPLRLEETKTAMENVDSYKTVFCSTTKHVSPYYKLMSDSTGYVSSIGHKGCLFFQPHVLHPTTCTWHPDLSGLKPYRKEMKAAVDYCFYIDNFFESQFISMNRPLTYLVHSSTGISRDRATRCNQLAMHDYAMHRLWSQFADCTRKDISAIRQIVVSHEYPQVDLSQYRLRDIDQLRHVIWSVRDAALAPCGQENDDPGISAFARRKAEYLEYSKTLMEYFIHADRRVEEYFKKQV